MFADSLPSPARLACAAAALLPALLIGAPAHATFSDQTAAAGVSYTQHTIDFGNCLLGTNLCGPEGMTGGAAAADVNEDGHVDLFVTRLNDTDILFCNNGDGTFTDCTAGTGLDTLLTHSNGAAFADIDNDGDQDLYVASLGDAQFYLWINNGFGYFTEQAVLRGAAADEPAAGKRAGQGVGFGDYDGDGYLDFFTTEWRTQFMEPAGTLSHARLYHNLGAANPGFFEDVTIAAGVELTDNVFQPGLAYGFSVAFTDFDADGREDLVVTCDFATSRLFWNNGDGTFSEQASGIGTDQNGMGSSFGDVDNDGDLDWFITSIWDPGVYNGSGVGPGSGNRLFINQGNRLFVDQTDLYGVREGDWGWGSAMFDGDLDGDLDIVMTNGVDFFPGPDPFEADPMRYWINNGPGVAMTESSAAQGITDTGNGAGLLTFDYDDDGDLDVFVVNNEGAPVLYRNDNSNGNDWLKVRVQGVRSNRDGIGAYVRVTPTQGGSTQLRQIGVVSQYLGHSERIAHFGFGDLGGATTLHEVEVFFPGIGRTQTLNDVPINQALLIVEETDIPTLPLWGVWTLAASLSLMALRRLS